MGIDTRRIAIFVAAFFTVTSVTISMTRYGGGLAMVWLGTALASALLITLPRERWPAAMICLAIASTIATSLFGLGPAAAVPLAAANVFEAWLTAKLLLMARPHRDWFDNPTGVLRFILIGGLFAPALACVPGGLIASFVVPQAWYIHAQSWLVAHGLGTLLGFPLVYLIISATAQDIREVTTLRNAMALLAHMGFVLVTAVFSIDQAFLPLLFLPIVPLLLATFRCGRAGALMGMVAVSVVSILATHNQTSPIAAFPVSEMQQVLFMQFYLATLAMVVIPMAVALRHHQMVLAELAQRKEMMRLIADNSDDALLNLDGAGRIRYASAACNRITGLDDLTGRGRGVFFYELDGDTVETALARAAMQPGIAEIIERPVYHDDMLVWLEARISAVASNSSSKNMDDAIQAFAVTIRDVTERKMAELRAVRAAETDALTGLPNRRGLLKRLELRLQNADERPFGLAILDLDHFKSVNDTHGHVAGDTVLRGVAGAMRKLSGANCFFARLGGEEFAVVATLDDADSCRKLCEELRWEIAKLRFEGQDARPFRVTASMGLAWVDSVRTSAQALHGADALLYQAKREGRNRCESATIDQAERSIASAA